jgi:hypothetical protein
VNVVTADGVATVVATAVGTGVTTGAGLWVQPAMRAVARTSRKRASTRYFIYGKIGDADILFFITFCRVFF